MLTEQEIRELALKIRMIAGYKMPDDAEKLFDNFHARISESPDYILRLQKPENLKWYHTHLGGIGDAQLALKTSYYHKENVRKIIDAMFAIEGLSEIVAKIDPIATIGIGHGNTIKLDSEYHSYLLSLRRCLEYVSVGLAAYFRSEVNSFRALRKALSNAVKRGDALAARLTEIHSFWLPKFDFLISNSDRRSLRDEISHYKHVPAGTFNITRRGLILVGGGEQLTGVDKTELTEFLNQRTDDVLACLKELLKTFIDAPKS